MADAGRILSIYRGNWVLHNSYEVMDQVTHQGSTYTAKNNIQDSTTSPEEDTTNWFCSSKGFVGSLLSDITAFDTSGLSGDSGSSVSSQLLMDEISRELTKLGKEGIYESKIPNFPLITFVDDDGDEEVISVLKPIFDEFGYKFTEAVPSGLIGTAGKATINQLKQLQLEGHEIASHGVNHVALAELSEENQILELKGSKDQLNSYGLNCTNVIYPFGSTDKLVRKNARKYYRCGRNFHYVGVSGSPIDTFSLPTIALGAWFETATETYPITNTFNDYYKAWVDKAVSEKKWLIFTTHSGAEAFDGVQRQYLRDTLAYINSLNIPVVTLDGALDAIGNVIDIESYNSDVNNGKFVIGANGEISGTYFDNIAYYKLANDAVTNNTPYSDYPKFKVSSCVITNSSSGFPSGGFGTLETHYESGQGWYSYQYFNPRYKNELWYRSFTSNATWGDWVRIAVTQQSLKMYNPGSLTVPANSNISVNIVGLSISNTDTLSVTPYNTLPNGLTYYPYVSGTSGDIAYIKIINLTAASITLNNLWNINVLKST